MQRRFRRGFDSRDTVYGERLENMSILSHDVSILHATQDQAGNFTIPFLMNSHKAITSFGRQNREDTRQRDNTRREEKTKNVCINSCRNQHAWDSYSTLRSRPDSCNHIIPACVQRLFNTWYRDLSRHTGSMLCHWKKHSRFCIRSPWFS